MAEQVIADSPIFETTRELVRLSIENDDIIFDWEDDEVEKTEEPEERKCRHC